MPNIQDIAKALAGERWDQALALCEAVLATQPEDPSALHFKGVALHQLRRTSEAIPSIERALELRPEDPAYHHNLAGILRSCGQTERAREHFRRAIELKPNYPEPYQGLSECSRFAADDPLLSALERHVEADHPDNEAVYFHFALGNAYRHLAHHAEAFEQFRLGNQKRKADFDPAGFEAQYETIRSVFSKSFIGGRSGAGLTEIAPIFIVGMPRSGTTLVEQILSRHPEVYAAGELPDADSIAAATSQRGKAAYPLSLEGLPLEAYRGYAGAFLRRVAELAKPSRFKTFVDKQPMNMAHVGLLLLLFPQARIIHLQRDPRDSLLSCYFQNFSKGVAFSHDLEHLAHVYKVSLRLMQHWKALFPESVYTLNYEILAQNQQSQTKALLEFCNLPWDAGCLDFHKSTRAVSTASQTQVRQPLYTSSIGRWRNYKRQLAPLFKNLPAPYRTP